MLVPRHKPKKKMDFFKNDTNILGKNEYLTKWREMFIGRYSIIKLWILPQMIYIFSKILIKFPSIFIYLEKADFKLYLEMQKDKNSQEA